MKIINNKNFKAYFNLLLLSFALCSKLWSMENFLDFPTNAWRMQQPVAQKKAKGGMADRSGNPVSTEFVGAGQATGAERLPQAASVQEAERNELFAKIEAFKNRYFIDSERLQNLKNLNVPLEKLRELIAALSKNLRPREANDAITRLLKDYAPEGLAPTPPQNNAQVPSGTKRKAESEANASRPMKKFAPFSLEAFIKLGGEKGIAKEGMTNFYERITPENYAKCFGMLSDTDHKQARQYVRDRIEGFKNSAIEAENDPEKLAQIKNYLDRIGKELEAPKALPHQRNYILKLAEKLLQRGVDFDRTVHILDIATIVSKIYISELRINKTGLTEAALRQQLGMKALSDDETESFCINLGEIVKDINSILKVGEILKHKDASDALIEYIQTQLNKGFTMKEIVAWRLAEFARNASNNSSTSDDAAFSSSQEGQKGCSSEAGINKGLKNSATNCYLNACMQVMIELPDFAQKIEDSLKINAYPPELQAKQRMHKNLHDFFKGMKGTSEYYDPATSASDLFRQFLSANGDGPEGDGQQDAQEAFTQIFNRATEEGKDKEKDIISADFEFTIDYIDALDDWVMQRVEEEARKQNFIEAHEKMKMTINTSETSTILNLEVEDGDLTDLRSCFGKFSKEEKFLIDSWQTTDGKDVNLKKLFGYSIPVKRIKKISKLPKILVIHLNRFRNQGSFIRKLDNNILFPIKFDSKDYISQEASPSPYSLRGAIFHGGPAIHSGHYWAFVKSLVNSKYYLFNDDVRKHMPDDEMEEIGNLGLNSQKLPLLGYDGEEEQEVQGTAYMLLYDMTK